MERAELTREDKGYWGWEAPPVVRRQHRKGAPVGLGRPRMENGRRLVRGFGETAGLVRHDGGG
jgi:hypothetical protein